MTLIFTALAKQALSEDSMLLCIRLGVAPIVPKSRGDVWIKIVDTKTYMHVAE